MGKLLQTIFALFVAYLVVAPHHLAAHFDTPSFHTAKAEMAVSHPGKRLVADVRDWLYARSISD